MTTHTQGMSRADRRESLARGRWPVTAVFFLNGLMLASFLVRLPSLKETHHLSNGQVGAVGILFAVSALVAMQFVGRLVTRHGNARVVGLGLLATPLALGFLGLAEGLAAYAAANVALGVSNGTLDVAMNTQAVAVERRLGRPILSGCHAAWSVSAIVASLVGGGLIHLGVATGAHLAGVAVAVAIAGAGLARLLALSAERPAGPEEGSEGAEGSEANEANEANEPERRRGGWRAGWTRPVVKLGVVGMVLMFCEGAALGWSGIFLHDSRGASLALASTAVMAFTGCQAAARVVGDRLRAAYGDGRIFRLGGVIGTAGLALAVLSPEPLVAVAGFAVLGLGSSVLIPLTFSAVGRAAGDDGGAADVLARFTTFTYAGILLEPALVGWTAELVGLGWTLAALVPALGCVALAFRLPGPTARAAASPGERPRSATA